MPGFVVLVLLLCAAAAALLVRRGGGGAAAAAGRASAARAGVLPQELGRFAHVSPRHMQDAERQAAEFDAAFRASYLPRAADSAAEAVRALFARRAAVLGSLGELRLRLPNDLDMERALAAATEDCDRRMVQAIEDARERTGAVMLHPGPVDSAWYGRWYRASNDEVL